MKKMVNKKVSVIIPCFNSERTIEDCVLSVLNQSHKNVEIICVNDNSSDNTLGILENLKLYYSNIFILNNEKNSGPSFSRNKGVSLSTGEFISFLDADDFWHEQKLELQLKFINEHKLDFVGSTCSFNDEKNKIKIIKHLELKKISFAMLLFKNYYPTSSVMMKKDIFIPFNEEQKYSEDYMSWLMIAYKKNKCGLIYGYDLVFRDKIGFGVSGLSSNLWLMEKWEIKNIYYFLSLGELMALPAIAVSLIKYIRRCILIKIMKIKV